MKHTITIVDDETYFKLKSKKLEMEKKSKKNLTWDEFFEEILS